MSERPPDKRQPSPANAPSAPQRLRDRISTARLWLAVHRQAAIVGTMALSVMLFTIVAAFLLSGDSNSPAPDDVTRMLVAADAAQWAIATPLANQLLEDKGVPPERRYAAPLVLGLAAAQEAAERPGAASRRFQVLAATWLDRSHDLGWPADRAPQAAIVWGRCLLDTSRVPEAIVVLREALTALPPDAAPESPAAMQRAVANHLLAQAYSRGSQPNLDAALVANAAWLANSNLPVQEQDQGWIQRADLHRRRGEFDLAREAVSHVTEKSPLASVALVARARVSMDEAHRLGKAPEAVGKQRAADLYRSALLDLNSGLKADNLVADVTPAAMLLAGRCQAALGDLPTALETFDNVFRQHFESAAGFAAGIERADLLRKLDRFTEAAKAYDEALLRLGEADAFDNPWLDPQELRDRLFSAFESLLDDKQFEIAAALGAKLRAMTGESRALELAANVERRWANSLAAEVERLPTKEARQTQEAAYRHYREAGRLYARLAKQRIATREYPEDVWDASECFLAGHDYDNALRALGEYLAIESRPRRSQALLALGEARFALGQNEAALEIFQSVQASFPSDPASFTARWQAALVQRESGRVAEAERLLRENLESEVLSPSSREWRESLFALGSLLVAFNRADEAIPRLEEALTRYPEDPRAIETEYLLAAAHLTSGTTAREKAAVAKLPAERQAWNEEARRSFEQALAHGESVVDLLSRERSVDSLDDAQQTILRNAMFARSSALFGLDRWNDSIDADLSAISRYQRQPETLSAYVQIAACYRRLNRADDARGALRLAKAALERMPPELDLATVTSFSRQQWIQLIDSLMTL